MTRHTRTAAATVCCLSVALACTEIPTTVISGTVVGHDSKPIPVAHVHAFHASAQEPFLSVPVRSDGSFELATPTTGALMLRFTGVQHTAEQMPLYVDSTLQVEVDVRLAAVEYVSDFSSLKALVKVDDDFTREEFFEERPGGVLTAAVESTEPALKYVLVGATAWGWCHGTDSEEFEYHPLYGYVSIIDADTGWAQITFDPAALVEGSEPAEVRFRDPASRAARLYGIWLEGVRWLQQYHEAEAAHGTTSDAEGKFTYDWSAQVESLEAQLADERDPQLREVLLIELLSIADAAADVAPAAIRQALRELTPTSPAWGYGAYLVPIATYLAGQPDSIEPYRDYLQRVIDRHPSDPVRVTVLWMALWNADDKGDTVKAVQYYERLVADFPDSWAADWARSRFSPDRTIRVGRPIPDFALTSMEDSERTYTSDGLRGTVYLLDFWATWCAPCVVEMPNIHDAYEKYKDRGFEVLSVAIQDTRQNISEFRERWPMPWLHAMYEWNSEAIAPFELGPIPAGMLVDHNGNIAAVDAGIRGERLQEALARLLGEKR